MSRPSVELRQLTADDWELWRSVRLRALADAPDAFGSTLARERGFAESDWRRRLAGASVVVLHEGRAVACGSAFESRAGYAAVVAMWVDPGHRGRGHSHLILDALVGWARERRLTVEIGVNRANRIARAAYEAYGFVATGRTHPLREGSEQLCDVLELR